MDSQESDQVPFLGDNEPSLAPSVQGAAAQPPVAGGHKKKRAYAGQAFQFGVGPNSSAAASQYAQTHGPATTPHGAQPYPGVPATAYNAAPPYPGAPVTPVDPATVYQQPPVYPATGYNAPPQMAGMDQITQGFGQMNMGYGDPGAIPPLRLNDLYPADLSQPFNPAEIDFPPPPIVLPPDASVTASPHVVCPSRYVRSTLNAAPTTNSLIKKTKLPFALVVQPFGALHDEEDPVPLISDQVISRCRRCRTYISPFVKFMDEGRRWRCNMCRFSNDTPQAFDWDSHRNEVRHRWERPELSHSVVDFVAPQEYMVRAPQPLIYVFLIDVSYAAVMSGLLATAARCIKESLGRIPNADRRTRLGFIGVDSSLHFFTIPRDGSEMSEPSMLIVSDLTDPFLPVPRDLLFPLVEHRENIENFLDKIQGMFQNTQNSSCAMGSALVAGQKLLQPVGGKLTVLMATLPDKGLGALTSREDKKMLGTSKEGSLLVPANSFYKEFAINCQSYQISVDMFLFGSQYQDVATLSSLPKYAAGQTYFYPGWNAARPEDAVKFAKEFSDYLSSEIGLEAVLRVRATTGYRMNAYFGNFFNRSSDLCSFPAFPRDQAYVIEVAVEDTVNEKVACFQTAVLHTSCNGERRIRVLTLALPTTQQPKDMFASADQQALMTYFSHKAVVKVADSGLEAARESLVAKLTELLTVYRKELAGGSVSGSSLQFCANLRALPVLTLGLIKNIAFRRSSQIPTDLRSAALNHLSSLPLPLLIQYIYPKYYSLHDMAPNVGIPDPDTGDITLPEPCNLSSQRLVPYGLYLIDNGQQQFLWLGRDAVPQLLLDVFGVPERTQIHVGKQTLPELDNDFNERVRAVIQKSADHLGKGVGSIVQPQLFIVKEDGEPGLRLWAQTMLVEDRADHGMSLPQWIGQLREKIMQ